MILVFRFFPFFMLNVVRIAHGTQNPDFVTLVTQSCPCLSLLLCFVFFSFTFPLGVPCRSVWVCVCVCGLVCTSSLLAHQCQHGRRQRKCARAVSTPYPQSATHTHTHTDTDTHEHTDTPAGTHTLRYTDTFSNRTPPMIVRTTTSEQKGSPTETNETSPFSRCCPFVTK